MHFSRARAARAFFPRASETRAIRIRSGNVKEGKHPNAVERNGGENGGGKRGEIPCFRERRVRLRFDERTDPPTAVRVSADFRNRNCMSNPRNIVYIRICILRNVLHFSGVGIGTAQGFPVRARGRRHRYARGARRRPKSRYATTNKVISV